MVKYKLTYFPIQGLGEPIRMLLSYLHQDFEDVRLDIKDWSSIKSSFPFGKVPLLKIDGVKLHQSNAICRYLAKQAKLAGDDDWEALQIDMVVDTLHDFRSAIRGYYYDKSEERKAQKKVLSESAPLYLGKFDEMAKNNGYLANGKLSWGDIFFVAVSDYLCYMLEYNLFDKYPNLKKVKENVVSVPEIKAWMERRPQTDV